MDRWDHNQIQIMILGGNEEARKYFKMFNMENEPIEKKYISPVSQRYALILKELVSIKYV
jgi:hypothetical protein